MSALSKCVKRVVWGLVVFCSFQTVADDSQLKMNHDRAKFNYQMFCQGCHTPDGTGGQFIPKIKDHIGYFLQNQVAREYLIRVPGSANAPLDDEQLAEVVNWMIIELGGKSVPTQIEYFTTEEVGKLRQAPLFEVLEYREKLVEQLSVK